MPQDTSTDPFSGPQMPGGHYRQANMAESRFDGVDLSGSRFYALMPGARFEDTDLSAAVFEDVNLSGAVLNNINLAGAVITDANLSGLRIADANLTGMRINDILVTDLLAAYAAAKG